MVAPGGGRLRARLMLLGLATVGLALTFWAYAPSLDAGFFFDDDPNIVWQSAVHWEELSWERLAAIVGPLRHPERMVANVTFGLNHLAGGLDPWGYHLVNIVIHLAVGGALWWVSVLWLSVSGERRARSGSATAVVAAFVPALLFLVHPLNTQAVAYVVQRMAALAALFVLLALACYLAARRAAAPKRRRILFALAGSSWLLALGSKENALVLPAVIAVYEICCHREEWRARLRAAVTGRYLPWLLVAGAVVAAGLYLVWSVYLDGPRPSWTETYRNRDFNGLERVLTQSRVQLFYLGLLLWPAPSRLNLDHDFAVSRSLIEPWTTLAALVFWAAACAAIVWLARRRPRYGLPLAAYLLFHALESGPANLELVFEHRMYLPMAMLAVLLAAAIADIGDFRRGMALALLVALVVPLAWATHRRNLTWADPLEFHYDCARKSPDKYRPQYNLGTYLGRSGRHLEAVPVLQRALRIRPDSTQAHNQLGAAYERLNLPRRALPEYREAARLGPTNAEAHYNLAVLLDRLGDREAVVHYRRFLEIAPPRLGPQIRQVRQRLGRLQQRPSP